MGMSQAPAADRWIKCISTPGNIRGVAIQATDLVQAMADRHALKGMGARGLGEAVIAGLLVASYCKQGERINLNIQGNGYYKQALIDAHPDGTVRGYVIERPDAGEIMKQAQEIGPWGSGLLSILRTKGEERKQPYIGTVPLLTGHLAKDLTFYWVQSEQIPSAVGLAVELDGDKVAAAGGFLIQALPGEQHSQDLSSLVERVTRTADPLMLLGQIFQSTAFIVVEEKALQFSCNCSWDRVERALTLVGAAELKSMLAEDNRATVRCDFCNKEYEVSAEALERLIESTGKPKKKTASKNPSRLPS
jgi:molecular chaperone Hsp33